MYVRTPFNKKTVWSTYGTGLYADDNRMVYAIGKALIYVKNLPLEKSISPEISSLESGRQVITNTQLEIIHVYNSTPTTTLYNHLALNR